MRTIRIATRSSALALYQANQAKKHLAALGYESEILKVKTKGDINKISPLREIGGDGLFVRAVEDKVLAGEADIAVHSGKDLPFQLKESLMIAAVLEAADPRDCLLSLPTNEGELRVIGTGSARRISEYRQLDPDAEFVSIRGNVPTRLAKLHTDCDAVILAKAGLDRLGVSLGECTTRIFSVEEMIPAACQGIIAIECRQSDEEMVGILQKINHMESWRRFEVERKLFCMLEANCNQAVGVHAILGEETVEIHAKLDEQRILRITDYEHVDEVCRDIATELLEEHREPTHVTLVGAGPGPGLITQLGMDAIRRADVVVYDDLIDRDLLLLAPENAEHVYVGKRYQEHSYTQKKINELLIRLARDGKQVVRLKGGDSFVFGRGGEEYLALEEAGITCSMIPGISSAIAVPESLGIPVTHRKIAQSFTVITGHTATSSSEDYEALAKLRGTLVFLMGIHALEEITRKLMQFGKDPQTPAAVLCRGFTDDALRIDGTLATIAQEAKRQDAPTPGILVIGPVAAFSMIDRRKRGLADLRVCVTGTKSFVDKLGGKLEERGASVLQLELLEVVAIPEQIPHDLKPYDWLVFTSSNGIDLFFSEIRQRGIDIRSLAGLKFACIGKGTRESLLSRQILADFVPRRYTAEDFGNELAQKSREDERILILRAEKGSQKLLDALDDAQRAYEDRKIYDTRWKDAGDADLTDCDYLVFASAEGVRSFLHAQPLPENTRIICIGEQTAQELRRHTERTIHTAKEHSADGILELLLQLEEE